MSFFIFFGAMMGLMLFGAIFFIAAAVFWLWMLIDLLKRRRFEDKLVWVLVLIFINFLGAALYYFLVYSKKK